MPLQARGKDELITAQENPASRAAKPRRVASVRRALSNSQLGEINFYASTTGDDPELDTLILRLHTEAACRTGGALALRPRDLNADQCLIYLREKDDTARWQPVSRLVPVAWGADPYRCRRPMVGVYRTAALVRSALLPMPVLDRMRLT